MKILVLGAGRMGYGAVYDLVRQPDVERVTVADSIAERAHRVAAAVGNQKAYPLQLDARKFEDYLRQEEPGLGLRLDETTDSARITGSIKVDIGAGVTRSFAVEIRFEGRDPFKTPRVWDAGRRFRPDGERHVEDHVEGWRFCLELDAAPDIDFADEQGLQSLLQNLRGFIVKQIMYEERLRRGHPHPWPGHAWDHGTAGHVEWLSDMLGDIDGPGLRRLTPFLKYYYWRVGVD